MAVVARIRDTKSIVVTIVGVLVLSFFVLVPSARGTADVTTRRLSGGDRYGTARAIANATFDNAGFVVLARGEDYPDALAGSYLAGGDPGGPVVLTERTRLTADALGAIQDVGAQAVFILGGSAAIDPAVEQDLTNRGYTTVRLAGTTRYDTARDVATSLGRGGVGSVGGQRTAIVASGESFADALSGGPAAFKAHLPLLLTTPNALSSQSEQALADLQIERVLLLGGTAAVSNAVQTRLTSDGYTVTRIAGANRQATSVEIAKFETANLGFGNSHVNLARGDRFPDSLAGGPHGGREGAPVLLTIDPSTLGNDARSHIAANKASIASIDALGGTSAIADTVLADARAAATSGTTTTGTGSTTTTSAPSTTTGPSTTSTTLTGPGGITCPPFPAAFCQASSTSTTAPNQRPQVTSLSASSGDNAVTTGDVHQFVFSEPMATTTDNRGSAYRLSDGTNQGDVVCGYDADHTTTANAVCLLEPAGTYNGSSAGANQVMRVRVMGALFQPATTTPTTASVTYPATLVSNTTDWTDTSGAMFDRAGSPDTSLDKTSITPAPNTTAPTMTSVARVGSTTATVSMSEPVLSYNGAVDSGAFYYDADGSALTTNDRTTATAAQISANGATITLSFPSGTLPQPDDFSHPTDVIGYSDTQAVIDDGDVVDIDANPMSEDAILFA